MKKGIREGERERLVVMVFVVVHLVNHLSKKPFRPLYIFKHVLKNKFVLFISKTPSPPSSLSLLL
jgi:hypothetical protein